MPISGSFTSVYGTKAVATEATKILDATEKERFSQVVNAGAADVFLGFDASVTTATGYKLAAGGNYLYVGQSALYGIVAANTVDVRYTDTK